MQMETCTKENGIMIMPMEQGHISTMKERNIQEPGLKIISMGMELKNGLTGQYMKGIFTWD